MVSVMNNNDLELGKPEPVEGRVSGDSGDVNRSGFSDLVASVENEVSGDGVGGGSDGDEIHREGDAGSSAKIIGSLEVSLSPESDPDSGFSVGGVSLEDKGSDRFRVFEVDDEGVDGDAKPEGSGAKPLKEAKQWGKKMEKSKVKNEEKGVVKVKKTGVTKPKNEVGSNKKGKSIVTVKSKSVGYGYKLEDQVWGKVKSHPWWPGFIYDEAFAEAQVLRLKRPGLVLVAFFGDGSYGYFDPEELIPFDPHFSEKSRQSRQTAPKVFQKAVDEAIDEACRRRALGLSCRCRNPYNFRPATVPGYMAVDVVDYEPGAVYSTSMIKEAREKFQPRDMLSFIKQSAMMSREDKPAEIDFIKDKATVLAYRRAVFEEFDETYAQAFGQTPVRPTREPVESLVPVRAHLSGPMVTAETLGKRKKFTKLKAVDKGKKDGYLFKRRDEPNEVKIQEIGLVTSSVQPAYGSSDFAAGDYVLQKRKPTVSAKQKIPRKQKEAVHRDKSSGVPSLANGNRVEAPPSSADTPPLKQTQVHPGPVLESKPSSDKGELKDSSEYNATSDTIMGSSGYPGQGTSHGVDVMSHTSEEKVKEDISKSVNLSVVLGGEQAQGSGSTGNLPTDPGAKKAKLKKRPAGELVSETSGSGEKKKKKRKKESGEEMGSSPMQIVRSAERASAPIGKVTGKTVQVGPSPNEEFRIEPRRKDGASTAAAVTDSFQQLPVGTVNSELKLSDLLSGLRCAALDPFHGTEGVNPAMVRQFFLKYRSLVYQKSLPFSTTTGVESVDVGAPRSLDNLLHEKAKDSPLPRPPRPVRPDDPTKGGRKRGPSDRQEEMAAKRVKKITEAKSAALEKKAVLKNRDGREVGPVPRQTKFVKPESTKKTEFSPRKPEPTVLVMKFPPDTSMPSPSELKARLARFGPLDHSYTRVFWTSSSCRVMYRFRDDAEAAYKHLTGKNTLFGHVSLRCHIRPLESAQPESDGRNPREDTLADTPRDSSVEQRGSFAPQIPRGILKKPVAEESAAAAAGGGGRVGPRVKFAEFAGSASNSGGGDQMTMTGSKNFNNATTTTSFADFAGSASSSSSSSSSSSHGIDFNSRNFQKIIPPPPPPQQHQPIISSVPPSHFQSAPVNFRYSEAPPPPRNVHMHNFNPNMAAMQALPLPPPPPPPQKVDISEPLLRLLHRCHEVVTNVMKTPGYKPYRPL